MQSLERFAVDMGPPPLLKTKDANRRFALCLG